jgi:hypothetical protein
LFVEPDIFFRQRALKYKNNNIVFCPGVEPLSSNLAERIKAHCPANIFQHGAQVNYFNLGFLSVLKFS